MPKFITHILIIIFAGFSIPVFAEESLSAISASDGVTYRIAPESKPAANEEWLWPGESRVTKSAECTSENISWIKHRYSCSESEVVKVTRGGVIKKITKPASVRISWRMEVTGPLMAILLMIVSIFVWPKAPYGLCAFISIVLMAILSISISPLLFFGTLFLFGVLFWRADDKKNSGLFYGTATVFLLLSLGFLIWTIIQ